MANSIKILSKDISLIGSQILINGNSVPVRSIIIRGDVDSAFSCEINMFLKETDIIIESDHVVINPDLARIDPAIKQKIFDLLQKEKKAEYDKRIQNQTCNYCYSTDGIHELWCVLAMPGGIQS